jgi:hypothetical protein
MLIHRFLLQSQMLFHFFFFFALLCLQHTASLTVYLDNMYHKSHFYRLCKNFSSSSSSTPSLSSSSSSPRRKVNQTHMMHKYFYHRSDNKNLTYWGDNTIFYPIKMLYKHKDFNDDDSDNEYHASRKYVEWLCNKFIIGKSI